MDKKKYFEPQEEVIFLEMSSALLAGSGHDIDDDDDSVPTSDDEI